MRLAGRACNTWRDWVVHSPYNGLNVRLGAFVYSRGHSLGLKTVTLLQDRTHNMKATLRSCGEPYVYLLGHQCLLNIWR